MNKIAGIVDLKGKYQGDLSGPFSASVRLLFKEVIYDHPQVFAYLFTPKWVNIDFQTNYDRQTFEVPKFSIELPEIKVRAKGRIYGIGTKGMGLDAEASSSVFDIADGRRFIPFRIITPSVSDHLFRAEGSGPAQLLSVKLLLNDPQLLIVDEPTVGLDPEERVRFRNLLSDLSGERIVILSTHIVSDVESTATDIAIIHKGQLKIHARPEQLLKQMEGSVWEWMTTNQELPALKQRFLVSGTLRRMDGIEVRAVSAEQPCPEAQPVTPNLEDVYLAMVAQNHQGVPV